MINLFGIQVISAKQRCFRVWNFDEAKIRDPNLTLWQVFDNVRYRFDELNN